VADFLADTRVTPDAQHPGTLHATLSPEWAVWGPQGGYVAAIALRAAMERSRLPRAASFHCHFLAIGEFGPVELRVVSLGGGKRAESLRVDVHQGERLLMAATVWMVDEGLRGYDHDFSTPPEVPGPDELRGFQELEPDQYNEWYPIWRHIEGRPSRWGEGPGKPEWHCWLRFNDTTIPDRASDALRQLFWIDFPGWNATISAHTWPFRYLTPNLDLTVQFHADAPEEEWTLAEGFVPVAADGLVGCVGRLWTRDGRLLATGTSKHVCRPNPQYADDVARAKEMERDAKETT
jgi:acyl-CoA thioesterase-2